MYDSTYSADSVEFISIVVLAMRSAIAPFGSRFHIVAPHGAAFGARILTYLYGFGIDAEHLLSTIDSRDHILADFFGELSRQLPSGIELATTNQVWQILLAFIVEAMKQQVFTVEAESLGRYPKGNDFEVGEFGNNPTSGHISEFINTISGEIFAYPEDSYEICYEVAHMQYDSV